MISQEFDPPDKLEEKVTLLSEMMSSAKHTVVHTGAGISTTAGTYSRTHFIFESTDFRMYI